MGIIVQNNKTKKIMFYLKGADSIMIKKVSIEDGLWIEEEAGNLSKEGLRTLAFSYKSLT